MLDRVPRLLSVGQPRALHLLSVLVLAAGALAVLLTHSLGATPSQAALDTQRSGAGARAVLVSLDNRGSDASACWVPGDLVGQANPAAVTAEACGRVGK